MPVNTIQVYLRDLLNGTVLPAALGTLEAVITPPPVVDDVVNPMAYVWGSRAREARRTVPRAQHGDLSTGGHKVVNHDVDIWLVYFGPSEEPGASLEFPAIIDATTAVLRNATLLDQTQFATDPITGQKSSLLNVGEEMSWEYAPVRAVADQRLYRFDAQITCSIEEWIQA